MQVKTYRAPTTKAVMDMVKADLGPDAVILSMKHHQIKGERVCEVTAALERSEAEPAEAETAVASAHGLIRSSSGRVSRDRVALSEAGEPAGQAAFDLQREFTRLRRNFSDLMRPYMDMSVLEPRHRMALEYLEKEGLDQDILMELFREFKASPKEPILASLARMVEVRPFGPETWKNKFHVVAGPCGVGKTSVLIRMALLLKRYDQDLRICLVNGDEGRLGGRLLLKHYAELSGLTYVEASDEAAFERIFKASAGYDFVLVDTPALKQGETLESRFLKLGLARQDDVALHLVLSPYFSAEQFADFRRAYVSSFLSSVIWTKLDEACSFGAIVNLSAATGLPVSALSFGAGFRDTMLPAEASAIWRLLFKHQFPRAEQADGEKVWA